MRILITGAEGFVGSNVTRQLCEEHDVIALDHLFNRHQSNIPPDVFYINCDLSKTPLSHIPAADLVIHLAAVSIERISETPHYHKVNTASMANILEYVKHHQSDLIFSSSASVYGSGTNFKENSPLHPLSLYSATKVREEKQVTHAAEEYGFNATTLRYSNCYGDTTYIENKVYPGKKDVIRIFMENALRNTLLPLISGQTRDFTYIDDIVDATTAMIGLKGVNTFNVATGVETPIGSIPPLIAKTLGKPVEGVITPPRGIDNLKRRSLNIEKIAEHWTPKYDLKEGIEVYANKLR